jgi:hypothetical protein
MAKITYLDFALLGDAAAAQQTATAALTHHKFKLTWADPYTATAERGSKVANALLGALAQYFKVGVRIAPGQPGYIVLRLERQSSGWMGGVIGAARTTKNMEKLRDGVTQYLTAQGVFAGVNVL